MLGSREAVSLPDGFMLRGVEGKLAKRDANEGWFFEFDPAAKRNKEVLKAASRLELLPSSTLERMLADANNRSTASSTKSKASGTTATASRQTSNRASYRLWGRVTKYKGKNFIFPEYFLPVQKEKLLSLPAVQKSQEKAKPTISDPNDELEIPKQILDKLKTRSFRRQQIARTIKVKQNYILANRTGFIRESGRGARDTKYGVFVFDALGRNIQQTAIWLLPCQVLELAEQQASVEPEPIRFSIAGIVTEYKGKKYLLLQRATRLYSHGNFGN